ncbi:hypothetical protein C0989_006973, partial [Termitomyces sp. Mn162]
TPSSTTWMIVKQCFSAKEKGKGKTKEPEPSTAVDEQIAHLLQQFHESRVPEDVGADIFNNLIVQLALAQVLNELDIVCNQRDEAQTDFFHLVLEKGKLHASPSQLPEVKKACTEPSVFVKESSTQRAPPVPYGNDVPAGNDQRMDEHPDLKASLSTTGPSSPVAAKARLPNPAADNAGLSRSTTTKAGTAKPAVTPVVADDLVVVATPIAFPANVPQGSEAGMIEVLKPRTYIIPSGLS